MRVWVGCVRVNWADKAYFLHQFGGFKYIRPRLVCWEDARPTAERGEALVIPTPW